MFSFLYMPVNTLLIESFDVLQIKRSGDTSAADSSSDAEELTSPKALRTYISHPQLTPVHEEVPFLSLAFLRALLISMWGHFSSLLN